MVLVSSQTNQSMYEKQIAVWEDVVTQCPYRMSKKDMRHRKLIKPCMKNKFLHNYYSLRYSTAIYLLFSTGVAKHARCLTWDDQQVRNMWLPKLNNVHALQRQY